MVVTIERFSELIAAGLLSTTRPTVPLTWVSTVPDASAKICHLSLEGLEGVCELETWASRFVRSAVMLSAPRRYALLSLWRSCQHDQCRHVKSSMRCSTA